MREVLNCVSLKLSSHPPTMISDEDRLRDPVQSSGDIPSKGKEVRDEEGRKRTLTFRLQKTAFSFLSIYRLGRFNVRIMDQCQTSFWLLTPRHFGESEKCATGATGQ